YARLYKGQSALLYGILYSFGRMYIEGLRSDSLMFGDLKTAQVTSLLTIIICLFLFIKVRKSNEYNRLYEVRSEASGK
ncbi:MAG: prolipoprotein diacylglyceryl transferase family protein, partial [Bacilli bacterium]